MPTKSSCDELADALNDSGPLELGVTSAEWLNAIHVADRGAGANAKPSGKTVRSAKRTIRELERCFSRKDTWRSKASGLFSLAVLIGIPTAIVIGSHDKLRAILWTAAVTAALVALGFLIDRYEPNVKQAGTWLDLPDRLLLAHSVKVPASELKSFARAKLGTYVRPVLIATDRRLLLARPANEAPGQPDSNQFELAWEIPYRDITIVSSRSTGGESPATVVTVQTPGRDIQPRAAHGRREGLVTILKRRAPEAATASSPRAEAGRRNPSAAV